ncbi:chemotaxis protein CheA [Rubellimicrobium rubrum]|uniref:Chemotaxis protein CheA n=1 Tax=Rubellimicrobium rubrum TaxID=2585369 RepID=A0A5C4N4Q9_9RHOB|nr:chemotaxis protein CheA [Rubellimicrobium rubrum]TNC51998.1 chemotaxis protein CheA [Rubellimicrobium rubrum]
MIDAETLAIFRTEADGLVESLEAGLLTLQERPGDRSVIDQVFRDLHTLKGTGGMFGQTELAAFVHGFESAFEAIRSGTSVASPALIAVCLKAHDHIMSLLAGERPGGAGTILADLATAVSGSAPADEQILPEVPTEASASASQESGAKTIPMMRISAERLDEMMDRVGELVIAEARLAEIAARSGVPALVSVTEDIQRLASSMRDATMSIRMTPISSITGRFRRLVHDLARQLDKPIDLVIEGEETELDKAVVEQLAEPLMHLIRNAADHGIEDAATRSRLGKSPSGQIRLSARQSGGEVEVELADDGRGLDEARIRAKAIDLGLLGLDADVGSADLQRLILSPGFSTAQQVTELSGRGVGMDVVRRTVSELRGSVDIASSSGSGTRVVIRLPLTLAIISGLLVEVAGERFTIPLSTVEEIVELPERSGPADASSRFLDIRGRLVPTMSLREVFASPPAPEMFPKVVIVGASGARVGLVVDRIIGSNQTVIKQLSPLHAGVSTFSGATILGDGAVALILDVATLVNQSKRPAPIERHLQEVLA